MSRLGHLDHEIHDARRPRSLRRLWLMVGAVVVVFAAIGVNGQIERSHRTVRAEATIEALIRQQPATFVAATYLIYYSFEADGAPIHRSTMLKASQWFLDDRTGIVCYDPNDLNNEILLRPDESCPG